jgi:GNAT superfamily N-acetyltransferase
MPVLTFRRAAPDESGRLTELTFASKAHWGYDQAFMERARPELVVTRDYLEANECWVADSDGLLIGWFSLVEVPGSLLLDNFFLLPGRIGSGLGRQMWEHALTRAAQRGAHRVTLDSDPNAAGFYERMGARRTGSVTAPSTGRDLPVFEVVLANTDQPKYVSKVRIVREKGPIRRAYLPAEPEPVMFGTHDEVREHYGTAPGQYPDHATTLDYVVAAAAG